MSGINWPNIAAIVTTGGIGAGLLVWIVQAVVRSEFDKFRDKLNGTYWRTELAKSEVRRLDGRIDGLMAE